MMEQGIVAWWQWCRLCAKEDNENNINVASDIAMTTAIGKYFWVNIKRTDQTQHICQDCCSLVNQLVSFTERVNKVQAMLYMLQNSKFSDPIDPHDLRSQYDLLDEDFEHIVKGKCIKPEDFYDDEMEGFNVSEHESQNEDDLVDHKKGKDYDISSEITEELALSEEPDQCDEEINIGANHIDEVTDNDVKNATEPMGSDGENQRETIINDEKLTPVDETSSPSIIKASKNNSNQQELSESCAQPRYVCSACGRKYKNATSYRKHLEIHNIEPDLPDITCDKCNKVFPTVRQLLIHNRVHLPLEKKLTVPCPHCDKKFSMESVMKQHVSSVHFNEKPFMCEECGLSLKTLTSFNDHKITHSNDYPYECEICKKKFKHKTRLKTHLDTHTETAYVCNQCGVRLNTKRTLKMHMLVHSEERAYKCNFCEAKFKRGKALKNHLILHVGLRPYKCNFCGNTFSNGSNCRSHKKRFHPAELAAEEAAGLKTEPTSVPKLSELRSRNDIKRPTPISRKNGGLPLKMRALLIAAERDKPESDVRTKNAEDQTDNCAMEDDSSDMHLVLEESNDDDKDSILRYEECEETVVYEFIEENTMRITRSSMAKSH